MKFSEKSVMKLIYGVIGDDHGLRKGYLSFIPGLMFLDWSKYSGHKNKEMAKTMLFLTSFTNKQTIFVNFIRIIHNIQYKDA
jgi:inosine/xanthosine triphosphate pyrophosphatase family protein